jgi:hypothetical protein
VAEIIPTVSNNKNSEGSNYVILTNAVKEVKIIGLI